MFQSMGSVLNNEQTRDDWPKDPLGELFFATLDQPERTAAFFTARIGDLRTGAKTKSYPVYQPATGFTTQSVTDVPTAPPNAER